MLESIILSLKKIHQLHYLLLVHDVSQAPSLQPDSLGVVELMIIPTYLLSAHLSTAVLWDLLSLVAAAVQLRNADMGDGCMNLYQ